MYYKLSRVMGFIKEFSWDPYSQVEIDRRFRVFTAYIIALLEEAVNASETSDNLYRGPAYSSKRKFMQ